MTGDTPKSAVADSSVFETREQMHRRIARDMEPRLILFCEDCGEMRRYTADGLTWYCFECGGGDLSTEKVKEELQEALR